MDLLILLLIFALLGYLLGISPTSAKASQARDKSAPKTKNWSDRMGNRWVSIFNPRLFSLQFREWVKQDSSATFPEDFKDWLSGLSEAQLNEFVKALNDFNHYSGYSLSQLIDGDLDHDPHMRQVFVEAISVYSQAYRKAREANNKKTALLEKEDAEKAQGAEGKPLAEKAPSRRQASNHHETIEP
ncbi:MAG: hypothetical protein B6D39_11960, partial [Anaerolineae bacterium UTCFX2]